MSMIRPHVTGPALLLGALLAALVLLPASRAAALPDKLILLSVTDVKGHSGPCGCHIPKGGFARQASYADSMRVEAPVIIVDNGRAFPELAGHEDEAAFMFDAMHLLQFEAVGVSENELRYGLGFLLAQQKRTQLPLICANLALKSSGKLLFKPWTIVERNGLKVGFLAVTSDKADLGPLADSLVLQDPIAATKRSIDELHKAGATVIVALSQLGKAESEDLATQVQGLDVIIAGRNVPPVEHGRRVMESLVAYGGEQGQYMGTTHLNIDAKGHVSASQEDTVAMDPAVGDNPNVLTMVRSFQDHFADTLRAREKATTAATGTASSAH